LESDKKTFYALIIRLLKALSKKIFCFFEKTSPQNKSAFSLLQFSHFLDLRTPAANQLTFSVDFTANAAKLTFL
jgi:hypothetical protein